jgi:hypothetical protein
MLSENFFYFSPDGELLIKSAKRLSEFYMQTGCGALRFISLLSLLEAISNAKLNTGRDVIDN